jgi:hypothetical protein
MKTAGGCTSSDDYGTGLYRRRMTGCSLVLEASVLDRKRAPDVWPEDLHHQGSEADGWLRTVRFDRHRAP